MNQTYLFFVGANLWFCAALAACGGVEGDRLEDAIGEEGQEQEIQESESALSAYELGYGRIARQSSTAYGGLASRAVDGWSEGRWWLNSVSHTALEYQPWWEVDLGSISQIETVTLWNRTDCCANRLSNLWVFVSEQPFVYNTVAATRAQAGVTAIFIASAGVSTPIWFNRLGRYVRVQLDGTNYLSLAEVAVRGRQNLALWRTARQSSTGFGGLPSRAVDGNPNGNHFANSVTHTNAEAAPYWEVDLATASRNTVADINRIVIRNRTDCCSDRLRNFFVLISDNPLPSSSAQALAAAKWSGHFSGPAGAEVVFDNINQSGRYVRIMLTPDPRLQGGDVVYTPQYLSLAEVFVFGQRDWIP